MDLKVFLLPDLQKKKRVQYLQGLSLPLDPSVHVKAIQPESTVLFSSNLMPMRLVGGFFKFNAILKSNTIF